MFFRRKPRSRPDGSETESLTASRKPGSPRVLGGRAVQGVTIDQAFEALVKRPEAKTDRSYAEELRVRMRTIDDAKDSLLKGALASGVEESELPSLVADAMNSGNLARIVRGISWRASGFSLYLLDGQVPPEALTTTIYRKDTTDEIQYATIGLARNAHELAAQSGGSFSIYDTPYLLQRRDEPLDQAMLDLIDAHMVAPALPPE